MVIKQRNVLSKFKILCWAAFIAILGRLWPQGCGLDTLGVGSRSYGEFMRNEEEFMVISKICNEYLCGHSLSLSHTRTQTLQLKFKPAPKSHFLRKDLIQVWKIIMIIQNQSVNRLCKRKLNWNICIVVSNFGSRKTLRQWIY